MRDIRYLDLDEFCALVYLASVKMETNFQISHMPGESITISLAEKWENAGCQVKLEMTLTGEVAFDKEQLIFAAKDCSWKTMHYMMTICEVLGEMEVEQVECAVEAYQSREKD